MTENSFSHLFNYHNSMSRPSHNPKTAQTTRQACMMTHISHRTKTTKSSASDAKKWSGEALQRQFQSDAVSTTDDLG